MAEAVRSVVVMTHEVPSVAEAALAEVITLLEARDIRLLLPSGEVGEACSEPWPAIARSVAS